MKLAKSLLLGSAAGLCTVAGAQAADLPVRKAAPVVEYVRVCSAYGAGFFFIPGTDTCLRVGGRARFEYQVISARHSNVSRSGFRTLGWVNLDARTQTAYGTLRTFIRLEAARRTGNHFSGTGARKGEGELPTGLDFINQAATYVVPEKAFIQFAGLTAGRASSFFDFYNLEHVWFGFPSSSRTTNLLAYTASFGGGFSATISMEDPVERRNPLAAGLTGATAPVAGAPGGVPIFLQGGQLGVRAATAGNQQVNNMPDFVGMLRLDQAWGSVQISGAVHEVMVGGFVQPAVGATPARYSGRRPDEEYGYAVQGGVKLNLPFIAAGDNIYLQAAYGVGATDYAFGGATYAFGQAGGSGSPTALNFATSRFPLTFAEGIIDPFRNEIRLNESFSAIVSLLHYWTPQVRQGIFAGYAGIDYPTVTVPAGDAANAATLASTLNSGLLRDFTYLNVGTNLIWSPVKDLDIGAEVMYDNKRVRGAPVFDFNKCEGVAAGCNFRAREQETWYGRVRVQRDF